MRDAVLNTMSTPPFLSDISLTDLPISLQSHILSFLCLTKPKVPSRILRRRLPVKLSLDAWRTIIAPLPPNLLPFALASSNFLAATADILGPRATYLTKKSTNNQLPQWVLALGPVVKAVSISETTSDRQENEALIDSVYFLTSVCKRALDLFEALSRNDVRLHVLDLNGTPFYRCRELEQDVLNGLVSALEQSSSTLKELALPVAKVCAKALKRVPLKRLKLLKLELWEVDGTSNLVGTEIGRSAEAFLRMLRALDHSFRSGNIGRLDELRLIRIHEAPCIDAEPSGCTAAFFNAIRTLYLKAVRSDSYHNDSVAMFVGLFPNLQSLHWNGVVTADHLHTINRECPKLQDLHLRPYTHFNSSLSFSPTPKPEDSSIRDLLLANQGKMKTLVLKGLLTAEQMKVLGESCPGLKQLRIELGHVNVGGLTSLLGTHLRNIRKLELAIMSYHWNEFGDEDWYILRDALCSMSEQLTEVVICDDGSVPLDIPIETLVQPIVGVLECLGERIRVVRLELNLKKCRYSAIVNGLYRILSTCAARAKNLECLDVMFHVDRIHNSWEGEEEEEEAMLLRLAKERQQLVEEARRLRILSFGPLNQRMRRKLDEMICTS